MKIVFRVDASLEMGSGHVMRCLTLAKALKEKGVTCIFICRDLPGNLRWLIQDQEFQVHALQSEEGLDSGEKNNEIECPAHAAWLGTSWHEDARQVLELLREASVDWLIVDHYSLDEKWEERLKPVCKKIMVIDDLADRKHNCDLLLDQNLGREVGDYIGLIPSSCAVLAGTSYALLRPEFLTLRGHSLARRKKPALNQLLISLGGVDKDNATGQVLEALKDCDLSLKCRIVVVMGSAAPWLENVRALAVNIPWETEVLVNVRDMAALMVESDLAIGAPGSTSWERCCLGLPTILITLAENQTENSQALMDAGAAVVLDVHAELRMNQNVLSRALQDSFSKVSLDLKGISYSSASICDGLGSQRLLKYFFRRNK